METWHLKCGLNAVEILTLPQLSLLLFQGSSQYSGFYFFLWIILDLVSFFHGITSTHKWVQRESYLPFEPKAQVPAEVGWGWRVQASLSSWMAQGGHRGPGSWGPRASFHVSSFSPAACLPLMAPAYSPSSFHTTEGGLLPIARAAVKSMLLQGRVSQGQIH